jgi:prevent-host-death family protein
MTRKVGAAEAKRKFAELLSRVQHSGDRVIIQRRGRPAVALVSMDDLESLPKQAPNRRDTTRRGGILECVGLFADFPEFVDIIDKVVESRWREVPRPVEID